MEKSEKIELNQIFKFIDKATLEELFMIIEKIQVYHDNLYVFSMQTLPNEFRKVEFICTNGPNIQLNLDNRAAFKKKNIKPGIPVAQTTQD